MSELLDPATLAENTAEIVAAYVANNSVSMTELPSLIGTVGHNLSEIGREDEEPAKPQPAVPIKKSVTPDYIICLEDGKKLKMLKRHLKTRYDMTPEEYRTRWGLPDNYPMVAPSYAKQRSELAKSFGLGQPKMKKPAKTWTRASSRRAKT